MERGGGFPLTHLKKPNKPLDVIGTRKICSRALKLFLYCVPFNSMENILIILLFYLFLRYLNWHICLMFVIIYLLLRLVFGYSRNNIWY